MNMNDLLRASYCQNFDEATPRRRSAKASPFPTEISSVYKTSLTWLQKVVSYMVWQRVSHHSAAGSQLSTVGEPTCAHESWQLSRNR